MSLSAAAELKLKIEMRIRELQRQVRTEAKEKGHTFPDGQWSLHPDNRWAWWAHCNSCGAGIWVEWQANDAIKYGGTARRLSCKARTSYQARQRKKITRSLAKEEKL